MMDVAGQCRFFNYLADLVDPKFYQENDREHVNTKYMKQGERAATKRAFKEQYKQNKRAKLDPDAAKTTTEVQQQQAEEAKEQRQPDQHEQQMGTLHLAAGGQPSREELLKRLHAKMEAARAARKGKEAHESSKPNTTADSAKQWREQQLGKKLKAKQQQQQRQEQQQDHKLQQQQQQQQQEGQKRKQQQQQQQLGNAADQPAAKKPKQAAVQQQQQSGAGLSFSKLVVENDRGSAAIGKKGKRPSKQVLLKQAEAKQQKVQGAAARQDKELMAAEAWRAALSRASGEKVLDDPKLLRKSLKREEQDKARKAKKWQERVATQQEQQQKKQDKRKDNLAARAATKHDNEKAKREKKLLRAGFEGRKTGFINGPRAK